MVSAVWTQNFTPVGGSLWLSALVALIPIIFFLVTLGFLGWKAHVAGFATTVLAMILAVVAFGMPAQYAVMAGINGFLYGLWPISWIIITAVFLYKLSVNSGQFTIIRDSILSITADQRILVILVGFCFGAFLEGAAGFGAPVAITAALLAGIGLRPLYAAGLCMIANTAPVAFGALGIPIIVAGQVSKIDPHLVGQMAGHQLPFLSLIVPLFIVFVMDGKRGVKETWPAALVAGASFALVQWLSATFLGPQLPDITSAIVSLVVTSIFLKVWQPKHVYTVEEAAREAGDFDESKIIAFKRHNVGAVVRAWAPFILLVIFVIIWTNPSFKHLFDLADAKKNLPAGPMAWSVLTFKIPMLHNMVLAPSLADPTAAPKAMAAVFKWDIISATGTAILFAALLTIPVYGMKVSDAVKTFAETIKEMKWAIVAIGCVLGFAYVMNFSGLSVTMALALSKTGVLFPFVSPLIGWLGVFLTGSDTSSNALFCNLQAVTAEQLNNSVLANPVPNLQNLLVAANTTGGVTGKMISPQSISIACAAVGLAGKESELLRFTLKYSILFILIICLMTGLQAYVLPWMIAG